LKFLNHIPSWLKNKYLLTGTFFVIWMFFIDPQNILSDFRNLEKLKELKKNEERQEQQTADTRKELGQLKTNAQTIEKYAREKYMMKKNNEDLYIVQQDGVNR
jgi:cell division protein DivIC